MHQSVGRAGSPATLLSGGRYSESVSNATPTNPRVRPTIADGFRSGMPWLLVGAACAFVLTVFVPPLAVAIGLGLVGAALVRRRADGYGMFALGFAIWCAVYVALAVFAALTAGDSSGSSTSHDPGAPVARQIVAATGNASTVSTWYSSPLEATPLTTYVIDGVEKPNPVSDLFVVGTVLSVTGGMGYSWPDGPQEAGGEPTEATHEFNHEDAWLSTVHLTVSIESSLYRDATFASLQEVKIGLALSSPVNLDSLRTELVGQRLAAPLRTNEKTLFRREPGVYGVLLSGEMLGFVGDDGMVSFPALTRLHHPSSGLHQHSLADLLNPPTRISLQNVDGEYVKIG